MSRRCGGGPGATRRGLSANHEQQGTDRLKLRFHSHGRPQLSHAYPLRRPDPPPIRKTPPHDPLGLSLPLSPPTWRTAQRSTPDEGRRVDREGRDVVYEYRRVVFVASGTGAGQVGASAGVGVGEARGSLASGSASIAPGGVPDAAAKKEKVPLQTLSVPLAKLVDGRLVQPWFSATYYEAMVLPGEGGGLSVRGRSFFPLSKLLS